MWLIIAKKDFLANLSSLRYLMAILICVFFVSSSLVLGGYRLQKQHLLAKEYKGSLSKGGNGQIRFHMTRESSPLLIFGNGLNHLVGQNFAFRKGNNLKGGELRADHRIIELDGLFGVFGHFDFEQTVRILMSLTALLFSFDAIVGEKRSGTLGLMMANAVPRDSCLLGKIVGGYLALLFPFAISMVLGITIACTTTGLVLEGAHAVRMLAIFLLSAFYILLFFLIGLFISARTSSPNMALIVSLLCWSLLVLVLPGMSTMAAQRLRPIPSPGAIQSQKNMMMRELGRSMEEKFEQFFKNQTARPDPSRLKKMIFGVQEERKQEMDKIDLDYTRRAAAQLELTRWMARITPASSYLFALNALNGTGWPDQLRFLAQVRRAEKSQRPVPAMPTSLPQSIEDGLPDVCSLLSFAILFFMGAYWSFRKYDVS